MVFLLPYFLLAQENYEIQVYASPTMPKGNTIFELHSNFTFRGEKNIVEKVIPSHHSLHETVEITHGITQNFEIRYYLFSTYTHPYVYNLINSHIIPSVSAQ